MQDSSKEKVRLGYASATWLSGSEKLQRAIQSHDQVSVAKLYDRFSNANYRFFLAAVQNTTRCDARFLMPWRGLTWFRVKRGFTFMVNHMTKSSPLLFAEMDGDLSDLPYLADAYSSLENSDGTVIRPAEDLDAVEQHVLQERFKAEQPKIWRYNLPSHCDLLRTKEQVADSCSSFEDDSGRFYTPAACLRWQKMKFKTRPATGLRSLPRLAYFEIHDKSTYRLRVYGVPARAVIHRIMQLVVMVTGLSFQASHRRGNVKLTLTGRSSRDVLLSSLLDFAQSKSKQRRQPSLPFDAGVQKDPNSNGPILSLPSLPLWERVPESLPYKLGPKPVVENQTTGDYRKLRFMTLNDGELKQSWLLDMSQPAPEDVAAFIEWFNKQ